MTAAMSSGLVVDTKSLLTAKAQLNSLLPLREKVSAKPTDEGSTGLSDRLEKPQCVFG
jgi:hypothetical protein